MKIIILLVVNGEHTDIENFYDDLKRIRDKNHVVFERKNIDTLEI